MVSARVDNKSNITKINQWNYACNINMTQMSQGKYTCSKGDGNMIDICHMRYTCLVLATTCNMTNSNM
jgi:hypothetical protein